MNKKSLVKIMPYLLDATVHAANEIFLSMFARLFQAAQHTFICWYCSCSFFLFQRFIRLYCWVISFSDKWFNMLWRKRKQQEVNRMYDLKRWLSRCWTREVLDEWFCIFILFIFFSVIVFLVYLFSL